MKISFKVTPLTPISIGLVSTVGFIFLRMITENPLRIYILDFGIFMMSCATMLIAFFMYFSVVYGKDKDDS